MNRELMINRRVDVLLVAAYLLVGDPSFAHQSRVRSASLLQRTAMTRTASLTPLDESNPVPSPSSCVKYTGRVRYSLGYDHLVDLHNGCEKSVMCTVKTNVNPEAQQVSLTSGETTTVITYIGSPAREFTPQVSCQYN